MTDQPSSPSEHTPTRPNDDQSPALSTTSHLARSTVLLIIAFGLAKIISLGQTFIIAQKFGLSYDWDIFVTASKLPDILVILIGGGALGYAFVPVFGGLLAKNERQKAWQLASYVVNTIFVVTGVLALLVFITAPWLAKYILTEDATPEQIAQIVQVMRILLGSSMIFSISGIFQGILHSHNHFWLPAMAPIVQDLGLLFGIFFLSDRFGIVGVAYGAIIGASLHFLVQVPGLFYYKMRWRPGLGWRDPHLRKVVTLMIPRLMGLGVVYINFLVANRIAWGLGQEGAPAAFDWGWKLMQIPQTLIGTAMGFVIFPTLAALSELGDADGKRNAFAGAMRFILVATIPAAVGLVLVGRPALILLENGAFDADATEMVYSTLQFFAIGIIVHSMLEIIARGFYADKDTVTPLWGALIGSGIAVLVAIGASQIIGVGGLALANTIGVSIEVVFLMVILRRRWNGIASDILTSTFIRSMIASAAMAVAILIVEAGFGTMGFGQRGTGYVPVIIRLLVLVGVGGLTYIITAIAIGMSEIRDIIRILLRREDPKAVATIKG